LSGTRAIRKIFPGRPTVEGAGVHLKRAFGFTEAPAFDPFLLFDDFHSERREDYIRGFPWHPHRGIETITYVIRGDVEHGDSLGNSGDITTGDVQWMTAGSGIIHQEMPRGDIDGVLWGMQLWANLPAANKMMAPRYRDVKEDQIPLVKTAGGAEVRIICGEMEGSRGPVRDIVIEPQYLDVSVPPRSGTVIPVRRGHTALAYVLQGEASFSGTSRHPAVGSENLVHFEDGDEVALSTADKGVRFIFISGKPIGEPVAWYGPIVMNTQDELQTAFEEYQNGTFIKE
jgi:hypothetical protein